MLTLLTLSLRSRRDTLLARFRARQIAGLCRFDSQEQSCIGAGAFAVAVQALRQSRSGQLYFELDTNALIVGARAGQEPTASGHARQGCPDFPTATGDILLRLVKPLPKAAAEFSPEDVAWLIGQLKKQTPFHMFEEIQHQNQEMLALLHALRITQGELRQLKAEANPSAA